MAPSWAYQAESVGRVVTLGLKDVANRAFEPGDATAFVAGDGPATDDDVSITVDGRRLDAAEAVIACSEELLPEQRHDAPPSGGRG